MLNRLRGDFQLASLVLFWVVSCLVIFAFGVYRTLLGDYAIALMDLFIIIALSLPVAYAWSTRRYSGAVLVVLLVILAGGIAANQLLGRAGLMWTYPVFLVSFLIAPKHYALATNASMILYIALLGRGFVGDFERFSYLATAGLCTLLAYIFAQRAATQRQQLETLATFDALTGAGNRRLLEQELAHAVSQRGLKRGRPGVLLLDLDLFKQINDQHGHDAGDRVLVAFSEMVRDSVRKHDRLFRFGGEEFVLLLPDASATGLMAAAEKARARVALDLRVGDRPVTVSIGAALYEDGEDWAAWLARADAALYRAKHAGRNRVVFSSEDALVAQDRRQQSA